MYGSRFASSQRTGLAAGASVIGGAEAAASRVVVVAGTAVETACLAIRAQ